MAALLAVYPALAWGQAGTAGASGAASPGSESSATNGPGEPGAPATTSQTPAAAPSGGAALEDITVTATRRQTNQQTTPVAVTAVNQQLIEQATPHDIGDLSEYVPNFSAAKITGFNAASFAIRGVGQNNIIVYYEPPVGVLVDDFVVPSVQTQLLDTFDVSQVEVLRGPQGTLFGKNTTGGAVVVHTKEPSLSTEDFQAEALYGSFGTGQVKAAADVPIIPDELALRLVGGYETSDGYNHNGNPFGPVNNLSGVPTPFDGRSGVGNGKPIGGTLVYNGRAKLLWEPTDAITSLLQYEIIRDNSQTPAEVNLTPNDPSAYAFAALGFIGKPGDPLNNAGITDRNDHYIEEHHGSRVWVDGVYWNTDIRLDPGTITSDTGYRTQRSRLSNTYPGVAPIAADGTPLSLFDANRSDNRRTFQQEIRFASQLDGPVNFVTGAFYQYDEVHFCVAQLLGFLDLTSGPLPFGPYNDNPYVLCSNQRENSYAGYIEATYRVDDDITLTGGFRETSEIKKWEGRQQVFGQQLGVNSYLNIPDLLEFGDFKRFPQGVVGDVESASAPSWKISGSYQAAPQLFTYFTYAHGFKSGGFNDQIGTFAPFGTNLEAFRQAASATRPEYAESYEFGVKSQFFDRRLRVNLTGFYVDYFGLQKQIVVPINVNGEPFEVTRFFNAASAEVKGVEGEVEARPIEALTLRGVFGYQDGRYNQYTTPIPAGYNLATSPLDRTPMWQYTASASYVQPVLDLANLTFYTDLSYVGRNLFTQSITSPTQNTYLNSRLLLNLSVTLSTPDDSKYVRFVAKNLTDKRYVTASQIVGGLWSDAIYGAPAFFGIEVGTTFTGG